MQERLPAHGEFLQPVDPDYHMTDHYREGTKPAGEGLDPPVE